MERDLSHLRQAASLMVKDLSATLAGSWACEVSDDYTVTLSNGVRTESCAINRDVDPDALPCGMLEGQLSEDWTRFAIEDEAADIVAESVTEILRLWNIEWPLCPQHGTVMMSCDQTWIDGVNDHDVCEFGELPRVSN